MSEKAQTTDAITASRACFVELQDLAEGAQAATLDHAGLEEQLSTRGRELLRQLYQDHLDLRAERETRLVSVADADEVTHRRVEADHERHAGHRLRPGHGAPAGLPGARDGQPSPRPTRR